MCTCSRAAAASPPQATAPAERWGSHAAYALMYSSFLTGKERVKATLQLDGALDGEGAGRHALGSRIWGQKMGSKGTKLNESEQGVWFSWKRNGICTVHTPFHKKEQARSFSGGGKPILPPNSGAQVP